MDTRLTEVPYIKVQYITVPGGRQQLQVCQSRLQAAAGV